MANTPLVVNQDLQERVAPVKLAILGTRGIPPNYGGFETFAYELSRRLVKLGYEVTVFGRHKFGTPNVPAWALSAPQDPVQGVKRKSSVTVLHKYLETPLAALSSFLAVRRNEFDAVLVCNAANAPFLWLLKLRGVPIAINVDGIERRRSKWNWLGRLWYRLGEQCAVWFADRVISDAQVIAEYYQESYACPSTVIAYGADPAAMPAGPTLQQLCILPNQYILYVSRLEPENNALGVIQGYVASGVKLPLVVVGDAPYSDNYKASLRAAANQQVIFAGYQFGDGYRELRSHCTLYIQATEVGGTHPALVEAMAYGNCILANDVPEHREVLADCGEYYAFNDFDNLSVKLRKLAGNGELRESYSAKAQLRAKTKFSWEEVTEQYQRLFSSMIADG